MILEKGGYKFDVNIDATKEYYKTHSVCDCSCCRNFEAQVGEYLPNLKAFLDEFGVDISKPDETGSVENEKDKTIEYILQHIPLMEMLLRIANLKLILMIHSLSVSSSIKTACLMST